MEIFSEILIMKYDETHELLTNEQIGEINIMNL